MMARDKITVEDALAEIRKAMDEPAPTQPGGMMLGSGLNPDVGKIMEAVQKYKAGLTQQPEREIMG